MDDPFFVVRDEVQKSVKHLQDLHDTWTRLDAASRQSSGTAQFNDQEQLKWTSDEIKSTIKTIEWDIQDLEETVAIVEANPAKFKLNVVEVAKRKEFVTQNKLKLESISKSVHTHSTPAINAASSKLPPVSVRMDPLSQATLIPHNIPVVGGSPVKQQNFVTSPHPQVAKTSQQVHQGYPPKNRTDDLVRGEQQQQMAIMQEQDEQLDQVYHTVANLKNMAHTIGDELDDQGFLINNLEERVDTSQNRMQSAMARLNGIIKANTADKKSFYMMLCLLFVILLLIVLIVVT